MTLVSLSGGESLAHGALLSGVCMVASYPGSPSSEVVQALIARADGRQLRIEWASNERVAIEIAIGSSIAGRRALVCTKSVGMNVMIDPLMALNLTPVHGGLVILLGDDPGGYGSQNDQDTRAIAPLLEMPLFEPSSPAEGFAMMCDAFDLSERFQTPVIVRETRSFSQVEGRVHIPHRLPAQRRLEYVREPWRFVPVPGNVVAKHRALHERLAAFGRWAETSSYLETVGTGELGILSAGFATRKLNDVVGGTVGKEFSLCRLSVLYPLPAARLARWLAACREVMVVEETEPFIEWSLHAVAHTASLSTRVLGKLTGHLRPEGELFRWQIADALRSWQPSLELARSYRREDEESERPDREDHCAGCRYDEVLDAVNETARAAGIRPILVGDPGCLATVADRLDAKYAIGSAIGVAHGLSVGGAGDRVVALFGDSAFFHSAISALCHSVVCRSPILMIVLDNQSARTSGNQPHPGAGRDALGKPAPKLSIERIARACDVPFVRVVRLEVPPTQLVAVLSEAWVNEGPALIVVEIPDETSAWDSAVTVEHD
jgi:indolepyruvate ferredoxin oxidoreductase alpha subunit